MLGGMHNMHAGSTCPHLPRVYSYITRPAYVVYTREWRHLLGEVWGSPLSVTKYAGPGSLQVRD